MLLDHALRPTRRRSRLAIAAILSIALAQGVVGTARAAMAPTAAAPAGTVVLGDFEDDSEGWGTWSQGAVSGSFQRVSSDAVTGSSSGEVTVDVSTGGYVEFSRALAAVDMVTLTFSVKSTDLTGVSVRLTDSTGQAFQHAVGLDPDSTGWQTRTITDLAAGNQGHWGGADDGVWHGPATQVAFNVDAGGVVDPTAAAIYLIDDVQATVAPTLPPAPPAVPGAVLVGGFEDDSEGWGTWLQGAVSGSFQRVPSGDASGGSSGEVTLDVSNGGYVEFSRALAGLDMVTLTFSVKSTDLTGVSVRLKDSTGQAFQHALALDPDSTGWQTHTITDLAAGNQGHWGGADDGVWHGPATQVEFNVDGGQVVDPTLPATYLIDAIQATLAPPPSVSIGDFEDESEGWGASPQSGAVAGSLERVSGDSVSGASAGQVSLDVSNGGYVELARTLPSVDITSLSFAVKSTTVSGLAVRFKDSTGQFFQHGLTLDPADTGWQTLTISDLAAASYGHWGGADDGVWHGPATQVAINVDASQVVDQAVPSSYLIDAIRATVVPPGLALETATLGNVFTAGQPVSVGFASSAQNLSWTLRNASNAIVSTGSDAVASLDGTIALPVVAPGWYTLDVSATGPEAESFTASTTLAVLDDFDRATQKDTRFGVATHFAMSWSPEMIPLVEQGGFGTVRDEAYWDQQETTKGTISFAPKLDTYVNALSAADINLLLVLSYGNPLYDAGQAPTSAEGIAAFANYAGAAVEHFGTDTTNYEVWNEFNIHFGAGPAGSRPDAYFDILKASYDEIKATNPDAEVIGPVTAGVPMEWLRAFFEAGGLDYIDALSVHPYSYPTGPELLEGWLRDLNALMAEFGQVKPIVISEVGWPTGTGGRAVDDLTQAQYLVESETIAISNGVAQYVIYDFMDDGTDPAETEQRFGLVHNSGDPQGAYTPKPSYVSVAVLHRQLGGKASLGQQTLAGGVKDYAFDAGSGESTHVAWAPEPKSISFETTGAVTITDLFGSSTIAEPDQHGRVTVTAGESPVYVAGPIVAVHDGGTYAFAVDPGFVGNDVRGHWTIDNTTGTSALDAELQVEGQTLTATVPAGGTQVVDVLLPGLDQPGSRRYTALVLEGGQIVAHLSASTSIAEPVSLAAYHAISGGQEVLRLRVTNQSDTALDVAEATWDVGGDPGSALAGTSVPAGSTVAHDVPLGAVTGATPYSVRLEMSSGLVLDIIGELNPTGPITPAVGRALVVDGVLDARLEPSSRIDLAAAGAPDLPGWGGEADLSGDLLFTWDEDFLYVAADVLDNAHVQTATGANIWQGDSLQVAVSWGAPGDSAVWNELGFALTPEGPQSHQWFQSLPSTADAIDVAVVRDDATKHTVYEAAIPWTRLGPATPDGRLVSIGAVLNDNDDAARRGWLAWGGGIAGTKDSAEFNSVQLIDTVITTTTLTVEGEPVKGSELTLTANVDPAEATGTVRFLDGETELGTAPVSEGVATWSFVPQVGVHTFVAEYVPGGAAYAGSTSEPVMVTVKVASTLSVEGPTTTADRARPVFEVTVQADLPPSGTIEVREGDLVLASADVSTSGLTGVATLRLPRLSAGEHHLTIVYSGNDVVAGTTLAHDLRVIATRR